VTGVYAVALVIGVVLLLAWIASVAVSEMVDGWGHVDPERRFGYRWRLAIAALTGFGLGGMSSTFAGWSSAAALGAAVGGGLLVAGAAWFLGEDAGLEDAGPETG
jgi:hypothetical protein